MKFTTACLMTMAAAAVAAAPLDDCDQGVRYHGHHKHKREIVYDYAYVTVTVDSQGNPVTHSTNGPPPAQTEESKPDDAANASSEAPASADAPSGDAVNIGGVNKAIVGGGASPSAVPISQLPTASAQPQKSDAPQASSGDTLSEGQDGPDFQDDTIPCSQFPTDAGVVALNHLKLGGWTGLYNADTGKVLDDRTGGQCQEGWFCSYACQPGMSKTQWPEQNGGVSIGGLKCVNGKLRRTNKNEKKLCVWGTSNAIVESKLDKDVAICRTDYPGTESMVIPTLVKAGGKNTLTTVNQDTYFKWGGKPTSAQYYVNNAGVSVEDGCLWSHPGTDVGNWAPLNFGAGYVDGVAYLSLIPNPQNRGSLNYNVKIVADGGATISGDCKYENGHYNGNGADGCTVGITNGHGKFVLYK
ncbi:probable secreted beta-glucosidase Sun4p [Diutina catenulata]